MCNLAYSLPVYLCCDTDCSMIVTSHYTYTVDEENYMQNPILHIIGVGTGVNILGGGAWSTQ